MVMDRAGQAGAGDEVLSVDTMTLEAWPADK